MSNYSQKQTSINELVVDNLILKKAIRGRLVVSETMEVQKDALFKKIVDIEGNAIIHGNVFSDNLHVTKNIYATDIISQGNLLIQGITSTVENTLDVNGNLILRNALVFGNTSAFVYSNIDTNVGINTLNALSTLDINGNNSSSLRVFTTDISNINIIARNKDNKGITTFANTTTSHIGFYNNTNINNTTFNAASQIPDAKIQYENSGTLHVEAPTNINMYSRVHITPTLTNDTLSIFDETLVLHGNGSTTPYLFDYYNNTNTTSETVATIVSGDLSTNTFLNIISPNKQGIAIGGGKYINDSTRSFGTVGLVNENGEYYPSLNIVSGNSDVKQKMTLGINTHSPSVDTHTLDINGPTKITNGDITPAHNASFEILNVSFSRLNPLYGIAIGTPINVTENVVLTPFLYSFLYTTNGGVSWAESTLPGEGNNATANFNKTLFNDLCVYNNDISLILGSTQVDGSYRSLLLFTQNSGMNWYYLSVTLLSQEFRDVKSIFINSSNVFLLTTNQIIFFNVSFITNTIHNSDITINTTNSIDVSYTSSRPILKGTETTLFLAYGNKIQKFNINADSINASNTYTSTITSLSYAYISVFNDSHAVAVGNNVISYFSATTNNWIDILLSVNYNFKCVYMYNEYISIAVSDDGSLLYSIDANQNWVQIPTSILNVSGVASLLSSRLTNVSMIDIHTFIITKNIIPYDLVNGVKGVSEIYYCYLPYLFDNKNNHILDVYGSSQFLGDINVYNNGKINSTNSTFELLNHTVDNIYFGNEASTIVIGNNTLSTVTANHNLHVLNDSSILGNIRVEGNSIINKNLYVTKNTDINGKLDVQDDTVLQSQLNVSGNTYVNSNLRVAQDTTLASKLFVLNDVSMNTNLYVMNDTTIHKDLYVNQKSIIQGTFQVKNDASIDKTLTVDGNVTIKDHLHVSNSCAFSSTMDVSGNAIFHSNVDVLDHLNTKNVNVTNNINAEYYEGKTVGNSDILIGSMGLTGNDADDRKRTIYIGSVTNGQTQRSKNTIRIGGGDDTVIFGGSSGVTFESVSSGKIIKLNDLGGEDSDAKGAGFEFYHYPKTPNQKVGIIKVATDAKGFNFQGPDASNAVKLDVNAMVSDSNDENDKRVLVLTKNASTDENGKTEYKYNITPCDVLYDNIVRKNDTTTQVINTTVGITGNAYFETKTAIGINNNEPNAINSTVLHIEGNTSQTNGCIWQF